MFHVETLTRTEPTDPSPDATGSGAHAGSLDTLPPHAAAGAFHAVRTRFLCDRGTSLL